MVSVKYYPGGAEYNQIENSEYGSLVSKGSAVVATAVFVWGCKGLLNQHQSTLFVPEFRPVSHGTQSVDDSCPGGPGKVYTLADWGTSMGDVQDRFRGYLVIGGELNNEHFTRGSRHFTAGGLISYGNTEDDGVMKLEVPRL